MYIAIVENEQIIGFNVLVGGGLGMTHGDKSTFPRKADDFGFIATENILAIAEAVVTTQRDLGGRISRSHARTKYTLETHGVEKFKSEVEQRTGIKFTESQPYEFTERGDRFGWVKGVDNRWHLTVFIENGRILDYPGKPLKSGLVKIAKVHQGDFRMTANQNLIIASVPESEKETIEKLARECGLINDTHTEQRFNSMACVALPTCPLAMAEAERYLPGLVSDVEGLLAKHGIADDHIILRVTGCPNGCGRSMLAEVGLVGKAPGRYNLYIGGNTNGTRIPKMYLENIDEATILTTLDELIWSTSNCPSRRIARSSRTCRRSSRSCRSGSGCSARTVSTSPAAQAHCSPRPASCCGRRPSAWRCCWRWRSSTATSRTRAVWSSCSACCRR